MQIHFLTAGREAELETAFASFAHLQVKALLADTSASFLSWHDQIVALAAHHRIPTSYARSEFVDAGGLISYGADLADMYH